MPKTLLQKFTFSKILLYLSIIAICVFLINHHYLTVPTIHSYYLLGISFVFLFIGFLVDPLGWKLILSSVGMTVPYEVALKSSGLYVFSKYIPGKFWMIFGRASYLSEYLPATTKYLSTLSILTQLISLSASLLTGLMAPLLLHRNDLLVFIAVAILIISAGLAWTGILSKMILFVFHQLKIDFEIPIIPRKAYIVVFFTYLLFWLCLCCGFYCLAQSFSPHPIEIASGFSFAFSCTIGIIALLAPGGIGVREGILTGYLTLTGLTLALGTQIAIGSRLWFICGELFIFLMALFQKKPVKQNQPSI